MQIPSQIAAMPGSPPRRAPQAAAPRRVSVWQRIEENPASPRKVPKGVHISPCKSSSAGSAPRELASVISTDCKGKSADSNDVDSSKGINKTAGKNSGKVLASVLVKPSPESKEKKVAVEKVSGKPDKVQKNAEGSTGKSGDLTARPVPGAKKVKKIVIKKIVRKIGNKDKQISSSTVSENRDSIDASANASEKEEGEITTSSFEKDIVSEHKLASTSNGVGALKAENGDLTNLRKRKAASAIESTDVLDTSGRVPPGKEDRTSMDSGVRNAASVFQNDNFQREEGEILSVSGDINAAVATTSVRISDGSEDIRMQESKVPKVVSENNALYVDGVAANHDTPEISGSEDARSGNSNILIRTNEEFTESGLKNQGTFPSDSAERSISSLDQTVGTTRTTEVTANQDAPEEGGRMLTHPSEQNFVSISSWRTLNTTDVSVTKDILGKEGRMPMELNEANTSLTLKEKASNTMESCLDEDTEKKESQMPQESCETNYFETVHHLEAPIVSKPVGREVCKSLEGSNERYAGSTNISLNLEFDVAGKTEDNRMEDLEKTTLNETYTSLEVEGTDFFNLPSSINVESRNVPPLYDDPMEDSTSLTILNKGVGRNSTIQLAELMLLHRANLSPENDFTLAHSRESPSVSGNSEHSVPTTLTLGSNIYFSNAENEVQPEENHELVEGQRGLGVAKVTDFDSPGKRKCAAEDDLIGAGDRNWLTLPPANDNIATSNQLLNTTVRNDRLGLDHSLDDDTLVSQGHDITQDMDECGSVDALPSQDHNLRSCVSDMLQSDLLADREISRDVEDHSAVSVSDLHSSSSIDVLDQYGHQMVDTPVVNPIKPVLSALESTHVLDAEPVSSRVSLDSEHTCHSNTDDAVVDSSIKPDFLSSWIEAIVSEGKKEHPPCKSAIPSISSPGKLLAPKEDSGRSLFDSTVKSQMNSTSSMPPKVAPKQVNVPSSSREPPRLSQSARQHRTWHRGNTASSASSSHASQPSGLPPKQPPRKNDKNQNSYIRKGNALIRNPATVNLPSSTQDSSLDARNKLNKPAVRRSMNFVRKVDSNNSTVAHSNVSVERPKTPPLQLQAKSINCATNLAEQLSQTLQKQHVPETRKEDSAGPENSCLDKPSIKIAQKAESSDANKVVYVRPKSNQLVAAQKQHPVDSINGSLDKVLPSQPSTASDFYLKKRKHQIILSTSSSDGHNTKDTTPGESSNSGENKGLIPACSNNIISGVMGRPRKALQTTNNMGSFSHVWTLSGQQPQKKGSVGTSYVKAFPRILPWKRKIYFKNFRNSHTQNKSSLRIVRKLLQTKKRDMIYTVSTDGFSIRKSAVLSVGGSSLKWSRSLEKRSQRTNEEAALAVTDAERKKGEKRKRQPPHDKGRNDGLSVFAAGNQLRNNQATSDMRSSTCNEYVRVSKGNQLVRNPKKVIRMLASDKVRWSLHTVRSRQAKKQQYCQFFTRFGECKKPGGKCRYIHDPAKVTICTKFLKGLCSDTSCKLTHKVLPERMQDCSYFLRGLCSNTACPYRHVKVNSNAPVCDAFLKGYCADGDECRKKHSYVCPVFEATGECPQQSRCKLHHPKKKIKPNRSRSESYQKSSWGRYFDGRIGHENETRKVSSGGERVKPQHIFSGGDLVEFISLGADATEDVGAAADEDLGADANEDVAEVDVNEDVAEADSSDSIQLMELDSGDLDAQPDNLDVLIKPLRIMRTARV